MIYKNMFSTVYTLSYVCRNVYIYIWKNVKKKVSNGSSLLCDLWTCKACTTKALKLLHLDTGFSPSLQLLWWSCSTALMRPVFFCCEGFGKVCFKRETCCTSWKSPITIKTNKHVTFSRASCSAATSTWHVKCDMTYAWAFRFHKGDI